MLLPLRGNPSLTSKRLSHFGQVPELLGGHNGRTSTIGFLIQNCYMQGLVDSRERGKETSEV